MKHYMNINTFAIVSLIIIFGLLCACSGTPSQTFTPPPNPAEPPEPEPPSVTEPQQTTPTGGVERVDVVYFHRPQRCTKCLCFEDRVSSVIANDFQNELDSGKLTFKVLNLGEPDNAQIAAKYAAVGSQLFINTIIDGEEHIKDIQEIWSWGCTSDEKNFDTQVRNVIEHSLAGEI